MTLKLDMTVTFGDILVTLGMVITITIAYFAMKAALSTLSESLKLATETIAEHDGTLKLHGEAIAALDASVFGRRKLDQFVHQHERPPRRPERTHET